MKKVVCLIVACILLSLSVLCITLVCNSCNNKQYAIKFVEARIKDSYPYMFRSYFDEETNDWLDECEDVPELYFLYSYNGIYDNHLTYGEGLDFYWCAGGHEWKNFRSSTFKYSGTSAGCFGKSETTIGATLNYFFWDTARDFYNQPPIQYIDGKKYMIYHEKIPNNTTIQVKLALPKGVYSSTTKKFKSFCNFTGGINSEQQICLGESGMTPKFHILTSHCCAGMNMFQYNEDKNILELLR